MTCSFALERAAPAPAWGLFIAGSEPRNWVGLTAINENRPFVRPIAANDDRGPDAEEIAEREAAIRYAQDLARATQPLAGTLGETYVTLERGIPMPSSGWPEAVRYHPRLMRLVAIATLEAGAVQAVQGVRLTPEGCKAAPTPELPAKITNGRQEGALVRLPAWRPTSEGARPLLLAEGPENGLSVWAATGFETWLVFGVSMFAKAKLPTDRPIVLCRDDDRQHSPADKAVRKAVLEWRGLERVSRSQRPVGVMDGRFIAYFRVSTERQGRSGLGLDAQRAAVMNYLNGGRWQLLGEFTEIESGGNNDRVKLAAALKECRLTGATLLVAKLDRLSRNAAFLMTLRDAQTKFVACDMPDANDLTVGILALVAQQERVAISERTKAALAASKARRKADGLQPLGGWRGGPKVNSAAGNAAQRVKADAFAADLSDIVKPMQADGMSLRQIADALMQRGIRTRRDGAWTAQAVKNLLSRSV
jgi:DNA invertase Pin-like site-specific DNA recombinase